MLGERWFKEGKEEGCDGGPLSFAIERWCGGTCLSKRAVCGETWSREGREEEGREGGKEISSFASSSFCGFSSDWGGVLG